MAGREAEKYAIELTCRMMLERYERVVQQAEGKPTNLGGRISRRLKGQGPS
jgi:hypothetical protein